MPLYFCTQLIFLLLYFFRQVSRMAPQPCPICDKTFQNKDELNLHQAKAHNLYKCEYCDTETFETPGQLETHIQRSHKSEVRQKRRSNREFFQCQKCDFKTDFRPRFERHVFSKHPATKTKPKHKIAWINCNECDFVTNQEADFQEHIKTNHSEVNSSPRFFRLFYQCYWYFFLA